MLEQLFSELDELMQGSFRRARRTICSKLTALFVYEFYVVKSAAICSLRRSKVETQNATTAPSMFGEWLTRERLEQAIGVGLQWHFGVKIVGTGLAWSGWLAQIHQPITPAANSPDTMRI